MEHFKDGAGKMSLIEESCELSESLTLHRMVGYFGPFFQLVRERTHYSRKLNISMKTMSSMYEKAEEIKNNINAKVEATYEVDGSHTMYATKIFPVNTQVYVSVFYRNPINQMVDPTRMMNLSEVEFGKLLQFVEAAEPEI